METWRNIASQMQGAGFPPGDVLIFTALVVQVATLRRIVKQLARRLKRLETLPTVGAELQATEEAHHAPQH